MSFSGSLGAFQVGTIISTFLLGITATQAWHYFQSFPNDSRIYWWLVAGLLVLDWAHSAISCITPWQQSEALFTGNLPFLDKATWTFGVDPAMTGLAAFVCQMFYCYRIFVMSKRKNIWLPCVIAALSLASFGFAIGSTVQIFQLKFYSAFQSFTWGVVTWLVCAALADVLITVSLVYYLSQSKSSMAAWATNGVLNKIIQLTIETNGVTAVVAVIDAFLFGLSSSSLHVIPNLALVKLYFNALLVSLNARVELEKQIMGSRNGLSHQQQQSHNGGQSVTTALGFGRQDVDPNYVKARGPLDVHIQTTQTTLVSGDDDYSNKSVDYYDMEKAPGAYSRATPFASPNPSSHASSSPRAGRSSSTRSPEVHILAPMSPRERQASMSEEGSAV